MLSSGLFVVGYVVAYAKLATPGNPIYPKGTAPYASTGWIFGPGRIWSGIGRYPRPESYLYEFPGVNRVFGPANWVDRRLRPVVWNGYGVSDHFARAAETVLQALESKQPELRTAADHLRDDIVQAERTNPTTPKWRDFDAIVWKDEAALRKALSK